MTRRIILMMMIAAMFAERGYAAAVPDDDSAIYSPYPAQPQTELPMQEAPSQKKPAAPKKKTPAKKKPAPRKQASRNTASRKPVAARKSSLQKGIELMNQDRYEQARPYLLKAIQEERNNPNAWYWYGVYHEKTGGFYQAQYFYSKAVTIDPAFEPLSRVVFYPNDSEKTPLWDPKRPARVYPVETANVPMNVSKFPNAPDDPEIPKVPVYTPPEPGTSPLDGDSWNPAVYVPPSPEELPQLDGQSPVYTPPDAVGVDAEDDLTAGLPVIAPEMRRPENDQIIADRDKIMRVDKPLYNPPAPGQKVTTPPAKVQPQTEQSRQAVNIPTKSAPAKKSATVPAHRVVHQKKASAPEKSQAKAPVKISRKSQPKTKTQRPASQDVRPQPQRQPQRQTQSQRQTQTQRQTQPQRQQTPPVQRPPVAPRQPEPPAIQRRQNEYLPPVGQYAPDPGTIPDRPIPPVGQGQN